MCRNSKEQSAELSVYFDLIASAVTEERTIVDEDDYENDTFEKIKCF